MSNNLEYITYELDYSLEDKIFQAYIARPNDDIKRPVVVICHAWSGRNKAAEEAARRIASFGYVGVAIDVYGKGLIGTNKDENMALMQPLLNNRAELQKRLAAGISAAQKIENILPNKIAAMGFCFGGLCVLDLARMNVNLTGVISIHGLFNQPENLKNTIIKPKVLALHGYLDPMVSLKDTEHFMKEMHAAQADWQLMTYGNALHAFTDPQANDYDLGTVYNHLSTERAWQAIRLFLAECQYNS
ncbi:MAG: dienelactone hydrolase family protein [Gammaproteobacteria bacterium]|nr:dienelactone hydrolase family protein [Gammaproteobacteria bacterium]